MSDTNARSGNSATDVASNPFHSQHCCDRATNRFSFDVINELVRSAWKLLAAHADEQLRNPPSKEGPDNLVETNNTWCPG